MKPEPSNVSGELIETHEFRHQVTHKVNWSHVLVAVIAFVAIIKLAPLLAADDDDSRRGL